MDAKIDQGEEVGKGYMVKGHLASKKTCFCEESWKFEQCFEDSNCENSTEIPEKAQDVRVINGWDHVGSFDGVRSVHCSGSFLGGVKSICKIYLRAKVQGRKA